MAAGYPRRSLYAAACDAGCVSREHPQPIIAHTCLRSYNNVRITYDPIKRRRIFMARGLDFEDAAQVFEGITIEVEDIRRNYGETRIICYGYLRGRLVVIGYTPRGEGRHIFSMRKANDREKARIAPLLEI